MNRSKYINGWVKPSFIHFSVAGGTNPYAPTACGLRGGWDIDPDPSRVTCKDCIESDFMKWFKGDKSVEVVRDDVF